MLPASHLVQAPTCAIAPGICDVRHYKWTKLRGPNKPEGFEFRFRTNNLQSQARRPMRNEASGTSLAAFCSSLMPVHFAITYFRPKSRQISIRTYDMSAKAEKSGPYSQGRSCSVKVPPLFYAAGSRLAFSVAPGLSDSSISPRANASIRPHRPGIPNNSSH